MLSRHYRNSGRWSRHVEQTWEMVPWSSTNLFHHLAHHTSAMSRCRVDPVLEVFRIVRQRQRLDEVLPRLPWWTLYLMNIHPDGYLMSSLKRLFQKPGHHSKENLKNQTTQRQVLELSASCWRPTRAVQCWSFRNWWLFSNSCTGMAVSRPCESASARARRWWHTIPTVHWMMICVLRWH